MTKRRANTAILCFILLIALVLHCPFSTTRETVPYSNPSTADSQKAVPATDHASIPQPSIHHDIQRPRPGVNRRDVLEDWALAMAAGNEFFCFMGRTKGEAQKWIDSTKGLQGFKLDSAFNDPSEDAIEKWGWDATIDGDDLTDGTEIKDEFYTFMKVLKLEPQKTTAWGIHAWRHMYAWNVERGIDERLMPTNGPAIVTANYRNYISKDKNNVAMVVDYMFSPQSVVKAKKSPGPAPDLGRASDMWFLQYYRHGQNFFKFPEPASVFRIPRQYLPRHIFIQHIITPEVKELFQRLVELDGTPEPDGKQFFDDDIYGKMLMGTAHGKSVGWFLVQHKDYFGDLGVKSIRIWFSKSTNRWNLYFEIGEV
ncbi:Carboxypeptidase S1 A [Venturia nashicola]|uniref:Carboxypeptidase S1 A n=1 Tax=Venturia nashicola TaxID=86259 RepID=A0A4Z1P8F0_9PEZI|nr:Carboxypeptidase S1 A [Venturia nashicola]